MVEQAPAIQRVRLPVRDLRALGERAGLFREGLRRGQVAGPEGEADGVRKQVLQLDFFRVPIERFCERRERVLEGAQVLVVEAASERQRGYQPVPEPLGVRPAAAR